MVLWSQTLIWMASAVRSEHVQHFKDERANAKQDVDVKALSDAIWTHKVVVVRGQQNLAPIKQWELVTRFDPEAPQVHSHGDLKEFKNKGGVLTVRYTNKYMLEWSSLI
jgi:alpha-ketoglutarate-dependent taurine dioxygenase